jgi:NAD(P)-dependent dehydrogenase (short-subunit alcohol dehydrogenase family)
VVVTGATAGIGRATALRLADRGATVVACARGVEALTQLSGRSDRIIGRQCDVADDGDRERLVAQTVAEQGRIDAVVSNVGIGWAGPIEDMQVDQIRRLIETNVVGTIDLVRLALPHLLAQRDGDIVIVASGASWFAAPPLTVYSATKYAVAGFAEGLRREVSSRGVRVHSIHPGLVRTQFTARSAGRVPGELQAAGDGSPRTPTPGPGFPPEWVAAAIERSLTRPWHRTVAVPRVLGATRVVKLPVLAPIADFVIGQNASRLLRAGHSITTAAARGDADR